MGAPLLFACVIFALRGASIASQGHTNLTFMMIASYGQYGFNSSGALPAVDMALEDINRNPNILSGYNLMYDRVRDSMCLRSESLDQFFNGIQSRSVNLALVGCGCSTATEPVAEISHRWNISQISFASGLVALSDRTRFLRYFRNSPTYAIVSPGLRATMVHFHWERIAILTQDESLFRGAESNYQTELESAGITVVSRLFKTKDDPAETVNDLFVENEDYRIFFINSYTPPARKIICEAVKRGLTYPKYVWMAYDWYPRGWWKTVDCDVDQVRDFLNRMISVRRYPAADDSSALTDAGITPDAFENEYTRRAIEGGFDVVDASIRAYDVIWVLALALNNTLSMVRSGDISETGCGNVPGSLVPLEDFDYSNERMGCLIQWNLQQTNFSGVSGRILFDDNGTIIHHRLRLRQYLLDGNGSITRERFAYLDRTANYTFVFEPGFNDKEIFPDGVPSDGNPEVVIHKHQIGLVVVFYILTTIGIAFAIGCLLFNFIYRERKIVKLSSPNLNYFIIVGAMLMYSSIYFYLLPVVNKNALFASCIVQHWLFTIGYSLAFGMVLAKMWRVYQIFHNPTPKKKVLKDCHLVGATMALTGVTLFLLLLETAIPQLRGKITKEVDQENPSGMTPLGIREQFFVLVCHEASSPNFFWQIFIFAYLAVLQIIGIILSFQTRKVKLQGLNDSKYIATIVYISSIVIVVLALVTFSLRTYINIGTGIFVAGIFILTTIFLALVFLPKLVLLLKSPDEEGTFGRTHAASVRDIDRRAGSILTTFKGDSDPEGKITSLQKMLQERDATILQLRNEMAGMKNIGDRTNCETTI